MYCPTFPHQTGDDLNLKKISVSLHMKPVVRKIIAMGWWPTQRRSAECLNIEGNIFTNKFLKWDSLRSAWVPTYLWLEFNSSTFPKGGAGKGQYTAAQHFRESSCVFKWIYMYIYVYDPTLLGISGNSIATGVCLKLYLTSESSSSVVL